MKLYPTCRRVVRELLRALTHVQNMYTWFHDPLLSKQWTITQVISFIFLINRDTNQKCIQTLAHLICIFNKVTCTSHTCIYCETSRRLTVEYCLIPNSVEDFVMSSFHREFTEARGILSFSEWALQKVRFPKTLEISAYQVSSDTVFTASQATWGPP